MRLGVKLNASPPSRDQLLRVAQLAEDVGYDSLWSSESYGMDAVSVLAMAGAVTRRVRLGTNIMQTAGRSPALTAMTALTLDLLSEGRFTLGMGVSGPQVVEGWHGQAFHHPLARTREYVAIVRQVIARESRTEFHGDYYDVPYSGADATGLGKPLKAMLAGRPNIPLLLAGMGPRNVELAASIADGLILAFIDPEQIVRLYGDALAAAPGGFEIVYTPDVVIGEDLESCRNAVRPRLALYIGGMGARGSNFYTSLFARLGFAEESRRIQEAFLDGRVAEAESHVSNEMVDRVALVGPVSRVKEQLSRWARTPLTTLVVNSTDPRVLETMAELVA